MATVYRKEVTAVDDLLPLAESWRFFGTPVRLRTLRSWVHHGIGGVRLRKTPVGGRIWIHADDAAAFQKHLAGPDVTPPPTRREKAQERRRLARIAADLQRDFGLVLS